MKLIRRLFGIMLDEDERMCSQEMKKPLQVELLIHHIERYNGHGTRTLEEKNCKKDSSR